MTITRILYNDTCPICSFEIDAYRTRAIREELPLLFDTLDQAAQWGISADLAARRLHVIHQGQLLSGVPAFIALWSELPHLRWLGRVMSWPAINGAACLIYDRVLAPVLYRAHLRRQSKVPPPNP